MSVRLTLVLFTAALLVMQVGCARTPAAPAASYLPASVVEAGGPGLPTSGYLVSGQPNASALSAIAAAGYAGVIDLRTPEEPRGFDESGTAASLGLRYAPFPVAGAEGISFANAARFDALLAEFDGPVLLHCGTGNRVGALFALRAKAAGLSDADALDVGRAAGMTSLEDVVKRELAEAN